MTSEKEIWKRIDRNHELSNLGRVRTLKNSLKYQAGDLLPLEKTDTGIIRCSALSNKSIHRLLAQHFLGYIDIHRYTVGFKDGNPQNISLDNLKVTERHAIDNITPYYSKKLEKTCYYVKIKNKRNENHYLGRFETIEEAHEAIKDAREYLLHRKQKIHKH